MAAGIVLALGVLVVGGLLVGRSRAVAAKTVPDKVAVHTDVPDPVKRDVVRLQRTVVSKP